MTVASAAELHNVILEECEYPSLSGHRSSHRYGLSSLRPGGMGMAA